MRTIRRKDTVIVKTGKDKGKKGEVLRVYPEKGRALVEGINKVKKHQRPTQQMQGGVIEKEASMDISNLQVICPKCDKPTRIKADTLEDGEKVRICKKCGEMVV